VASGLSGNESLLSGKNSSVNKSELRKLYLQKRQELSPEEMDIKALTIVWNFSGLDFTQVKYLHLFYPIAKKLEFNTISLANWIRNIHPEIKLVLSKSDHTTNTLSHFIWEPDTPLTVTPFGITEPDSGIPINPDQLDMIVVPLLAFDTKGNRIGYGKGFYDRFLADCRADAQKIGVSFFPPVEEISDINEFDIPLDACVSPEMIWKFSGES
jgi:5-formyltetrahydrofolate cyclo-ligase